MSIMQLKKYTKPYMPMIVISIFLLFGQATAELALPDYLSNIVNIGIQQGGVEESAPTAIRESQMGKISIFMDDENYTKVLGNYELKNSSSANYDEYLETYPVLRNQSVYVLKDLADDEFEKLEEIMAKPMIIIFMIDQMIENPDAIPEGNAGSLFNMSALPPGVSIYDYFQMMNATQLGEIKKAILEEFDALGDMMIEQVSIQAVRTEYEYLEMDMKKIQNAYMAKVTLIMVLITLAAMVCTIAVGFLAAKTATGMALDIRKDLFEKIERFSNEEFDKFSTASLITRTTNDITQVQMVVMMTMRILFYAPIMGVGGILRALNKSASMWWLIAVAVGIMMTVVMVIFKIALPKFKEMQKITDRLNLVTRENLTGMMVIRAFNMEKFEEKRFEETNQDLTATSLFINKVMVFLMPFMMLIMNVLVVSIIWMGSQEVANANMQVGDMMAFMQYSMQIVMSFLMLSMMFIMIPRASVSGTRIAEVLNTDPSISDLNNAETFGEKFEGVIKFDHVSFRYPGAEEDALHDLDFTMQPGQTTAIIGATGSGKSTLINLIPRFYDVTAGTILINGTNIKNVTQHDLRDKIGYVPQKSSLFSGTIESNLLYANENATGEEINSAIDISQARVFLDNKEEGLASKISQGGINVSGGQKQRLSIARALVKKPPIYILDDSFSALDFKTDAALRKAFKKEVGSSTLIIVSQRVSTIKTAEQIIVLDEGKIVGKGTHQELMANCNIYSEIALSQNTEDELR
jgi:ATP-binding cassette, subfamily B, multidrug efflux pump